MVRCDGLYVELTPAGGAQRFLRFYPDGEVLYAWVEGSAAAEDVARWLGRRASRPNVARARYGVYPAGTGGWGRPSSDALDGIRFSVPVVEHETRQDSQDRPIAVVVRTSAVIHEGTIDDDFIRMKTVGPAPLHVGARTYCFVAVAAMAE